MSVLIAITITVFTSTLYIVTAILHGRTIQELEEALEAIDNLQTTLARVAIQHQKEKRDATFIMGHLSRACGHAITGDPHTAIALLGEIHGGQTLND